MHTTDRTSQPLRLAMIFLFFWAFFLSSLPAETAQAAGALPVANPDFNPSPGTFTGSVSVRLTTRTSGATIRYTTNGSNPTLSSTVYSSPLVFASTTTLKARAFKTGMNDSGVTTGTYTVTASSTFTASGRVTDSSGTGIPGVTMTFTRVSGSGALPSAVSTDASGNWSRAGFQAGTTYRVTPSKSGCTAFSPPSRDFSSAGTGQSFTCSAAPRVVLLLHGMNSDPKTWNDFLIDSKYGNGPAMISAPIIYGGKKDSSTARPDQKGVLYYRLKFGSRDGSSGRIGVEPDVFSKGGDSGDFSYFNDLGNEVRDAVTLITRTLHPNANVLLISHSRGGIAGRIFLQVPASSNEKASIVALVTTGTPHSGSPLGRLYSYLKAYPRTNPGAKDDWKIVDCLRGGVLLCPKNLDVRRPTIDDLSMDSTAIATLQNESTYLPASVKYGTQRYDGVTLGNLQLDYNVFAGHPTHSSLLPPLTAVASKAILKSAPRDRFVGDGIVPTASQTFTSSHITVAVRTNSSGRIVHIDEPGQKADLRAITEALVPWWQ